MLAVVEPSACARPDYPPASLREGDEATVVRMFPIGIDGIATESRIERSSGFKWLDEAARRALALCKFKPGTENGEPLQSWARIDYKWQIQDAQ
jgi:protein TonB